MSSRQSQLVANPSILCRENLMIMYSLAQRVQNWILSRLSSLLATLQRYLTKSYTVVIVLANTLSYNMQSLDEKLIKHILKSLEPIWAHGSKYSGYNMHFKKIFFCKWREIASSNPSHLKALVSFFRLLMKGIFGPYVLWPFDKK